MPKTKTEFLVRDPSLTLGSSHANFVVSQIESIEELSATAYVFYHKQSKARLLWIACADTDRSFSIAFKTAPADDTGVFHILEHSVLCGSKRFPVKEPFVHLLKTSMQTFLNALTFFDKTMYPVSSTNVLDLENLMDVYLDAVFHPCIYTKPAIFKQEGWHFELTGKGALDERDLIYNGVVLNEMKGALSDPDEVALEALNKALFPDTAYRFESGGKPEAIVNLNYEQFVDTHARHYKLSNSYTILYGDLDIERELAFIDKRFQEVLENTAGDPNPLKEQKAIKTGLKQIHVPTTQENASVTLGFVIGDFSERKKMLAASILLDALAGSNEAPLKRAVLDSHLGKDFVSTIIDSQLQPELILQLKNAKPQAGQKFIDLIQSVSAHLAKEGIPRRRLEASLSQAEFNLREGDWGSYGNGVGISIQVMASWLYDENNPVAYLHYQEELNDLKNKVSSGYFERLLEELIANSKHCAAIELVPVKDGAKDNSETLRLQKIKAHLDKTALNKIYEETQELRAEQERAETPEDLATLPQLHIKDIADAPDEKEAFVDPNAPFICRAHELDTHGINYLRYYFDLRRIKADDLPYVGILVDLLGKLDTKNHSASELDMLAEHNLGSLDFVLETFDRDDDPSFVMPKLVVSTSALAEKFNYLTELPQEVWAHTLFADTARMKAILQQRIIALQQYFLNSGHAAALERLSTYFSLPAAAADRFAGIDYFFFLKDLLRSWDDRKEELCIRLTQLAQTIFTDDELLVSFVGSAQERKNFLASAARLKLPHAGAEKTAHVLDLSRKENAFLAHEAFIIPSDICFIAAGKPSYDGLLSKLGSWQVAQRLLSYDYLWNEVRVKGGAYGVGMRHTTSKLIQFWSFRDPAIDPSFTRFEKAKDWLLAWDGSLNELEGYIVSSVAGHDRPLKPKQQALRQDTLFLSGKDTAWRDRIRKEELETTKADLHALADALALSQENSALCVFGSADIIKQSKFNFEIKELFDTQDENDAH